MTSHTLRQSGVGRFLASSQRGQTPILSTDSSAGKFRSSLSTFHQWLLHNVRRHPRHLRMGLTVQQRSVPSPFGSTSLPLTCSMFKNRLTETLQATIMMRWSLLEVMCLTYSFITLWTSTNRMYDTAQLTLHKNCPQELGFHPPSITTMLLVAQSARHVIYHCYPKDGYGLIISYDYVLLHTRPLMWGSYTTSVTLCKDFLLTFVAQYFYQFPRVSQ